MLNFSSRATETEKIFEVKFPIDGLLSISWEPKELKKLQKLDKSELASDQLKMLSMLAKKMELGSEEQISYKTGDKSEHEQE